MNKLTQWIVIALLVANIVITCIFYHNIRYTLYWNRKTTIDSQVDIITHMDNRIDEILEIMY